MQDNEFDKLFRSKLDDFEAEPSANVWAGIKKGLSAAERTKYLFPFLGIAASLLILVTAGILFIPHHVKLNGKNPVQNKIAKAINTPIAKSGSIHNTSLSAKQKGLNEISVAANTTRKLHPAKVNRNPAAVGLPQPKNAVNPEDQPELAVIQEKRPEIINAVVPNENIPLSIKQPVEDMTGPTAKPLLVTAQLPADNPDAVPVKQKHRMRGLGDFINVVVAKVDKRRDKIIEFSETDDESMVTGINLGIIKLKKEK